ncbi:MAG: Hpt domain-containing protein [Actinobacteria bacterium]|nr:Hpt domain-containing protein [Actinomycetota bacterium]
MTRIEGEDFRRLFEQEAATRLPRLAQQLLELERHETDAELLASVFREAHTIKGAAAVVGLDDASRVAHALEDVLDDVRHGRRAVTPALIDISLTVVDGLTAMIPRLIAGEDCGTDADALEAVLRDGASRATTDAFPPVDAGSATRPARRSSPPPENAPRRRLQDMDTIAVPVSRLDDLVRLVGESAAAHLRVGRVLADRLDVDPGTVAEYHELSRVLNELQERTMRARMVPVATITDQLHRAVQDLSRSLEKHAVLEVRGGDTELDRGMLQQLADPLLHLVRNAMDHGIEPPEERAGAGKPPEATIRLHAMQLGSR